MSDSTTTKCHEIKLTWNKYRGIDSIVAVRIFNYCLFNALTRASDSGQHNLGATFSATAQNHNNGGINSTDVVYFRQESNLINLISNGFLFIFNCQLEKACWVTLEMRLPIDYISIKSKIGVEFRRYSLGIKDVQSFGRFYNKIESYHHLDGIPFVIFYTDPEDSLLPINNDDNLAKAITSTRQRRPYLKLLIERKGMPIDYYNGKKGQHFKGFSNLIMPRPSIGMPEDFRQVSSIIDVDIVPETCRRVRIVKHGSDRPLGFYIRDGTYKRINAHGQLQLVTGVFISRLVPGGLAESTGLLAVNDEVLEVNGIRVTDGKTLDQVTDMMVANSSNLIITIRPGKTDNLS